MATEIDCEQALRQIFQYVDHELAPHEHEAMQKHLHLCQSCFSRAEFERRLKQKLRRLREEEASSPLLRDRIRRLLDTF